MAAPRASKIESGQHAHAGAQREAGDGGTRGRWRPTAESRTSLGHGRCDRHGTPKRRAEISGVF
eukprot:4871374-Pleurochrysis_carterae.AAC.1